MKRFQLEYAFVNPVNDDKTILGTLKRGMDSGTLMDTLIILEPLKAGSWHRSVETLRRGGSVVLEKLEAMADGSKLLKLLRITRTR